MKLALISYRQQARYAVGTQSDEDQNLLEYLRGRGLDVDLVIWDDPQVDWRSYNKAILKSPWDYHEKFPEFMAWLKRLEKLEVALLNPYAVVHWNLDKHYLKDIMEAGLPVIPAIFLNKHSKPELADFFTRFDAPQLVIKPCVSASARNTLVVDKHNLAERQQQLHAFLLEEDFLVQPFAKEITEGELSFIFFGNAYSHSVLKLPKAGDFRVQHFHGGTIRKAEPAEAQVREAQAYVERFAAGCLYARVDGVLINNRFQLMELELIEPFLFLDTDARACENYYTALMKLIA